MSEGMLPTFLIAGAQRCGSTTLFSLMRQHPQLFLARPKELHFFDRYWDRGIDWYRSQFWLRRGQLQAGEATPIYMYEEVSRQRMIETVPEARLVVILRNPTERAYSHYWHSRRRDKVAEGDFEAALDREDSRLVNASVKERRHYSYMDRGQYVEQLLPLEGAYGRDRLHVMLLEDLLKDRVAALEGLFAFLGVDPAVAASLEPKWRMRRQDEYAPMSEETKKRLDEHFRPYNEQLGQWLGRDLSHWG